jgi:hypothetical protein
MDNAGYTEIACREEAHFGLSGMEETAFGKTWNGLELRKSVLA